MIGETLEGVWRVVGSGLVVKINVAFDAAKTTRNVR